MNTASSLVGMNIDWNTVEEVGFKPLPAGEYGAKIKETKFAPSKSDPNSLMLTIVYSLLGGKGVKNRIVRDFFIIKSSDPQKEINGRGKYKRFMSSIERDPNELQDFSELIGQLVGVTLRIDEARGQYGPQNSIKKYITFNEDLLNGNPDSDLTSF